MLSVDGHDPGELQTALTWIGGPPGIPTAVIARTTSEQFPFLRGLDAHYYIMKDEDFLSATQSLKTGH